jgi:hypothetical protein
MGPPSGLASSTSNSIVSAPQVGTVIFQHVRNLSGITATLSEPPVVDDEPPLPFLGNLAKSYLQAHGYNTSSILHISCSYQQSSSADDFVNSLSRKGLPVTEAKYLWDIISSEAPDFTFG